MAPGQTQPGAWVAFWRSVAKFETSKINPWLALRNALGVAVPLFIGAATGHLGAGLIASTGALQVAFRDSDGPYPDRARLMLAGSVIAGFTVSIAMIGGNHALAALPLAVVWAFASGMLVALGQAAGDLGLMSVVLLVIYEAVPMPAERAALSGLAAFAGGVLQTALAIANWPIDPYGPSRRALGDLFLELARAISMPSGPTDSPLATAQTIRAYSSLQTLDADRSLEADRFRFLLSQAERLRVNLLALRRLRVRLERDVPSPATCAVIDRFLADSARAAMAIGHALKSKSVPVVAGGELESMAESLRADESEMVADTRVQMDAIAGQFRSAEDVIADASAAAWPASLAAPKRRSHLFRDRANTLLANLSLESSAFRHAVRLAICIAAGETVAHLSGTRRPYWIPMTIAIVLKPDFASTFSRGVLRLVGTFVGIVFATGLVRVLPETIYAHIAAVGVLMFVMRSLGAANYGVFATAVTAMVVFLIWLNGVAPIPVMGARAVNTAAGGAIALAAYWLWPTWERSQVSETMARTLDSFGVYFRALVDNYSTRTHASAAALDRTRGTGRLARSNFEASVERACAEPGVTEEIVRRLRAMVASLHRLAHAFLALEAGIAASRATPRPAFRRFAGDLDLTLARLSSALRSNRAEPVKLPDLREDHHELIHSPGSEGIYALVNVETDRITNSVNTVAGEILEWITRRGPR